MAVYEHAEKVSTEKEKKAWRYSNQIFYYNIRLSEDEHGVEGLKSRQGSKLFHSQPF